MYIAPNFCGHHMLVPKVHRSSYTKGLVSYAVVLVIRLCEYSQNRILNNHIHDHEQLKFATVKKNA